MHKFLFLLLIFTPFSLMAQNGTATTEKKTFSRTTSVSIDIQADPATVWSLLTDAAEMPNWNSTIVSLEGDIQVGNKIQLVSTLDPSRTFKLKVKEMQPKQRLVWGDAMGERTYTLEPTSGGTRFSMQEKIGGPIFPLFASKIPSFDESFEQFAADLKATAEKG
ncbi:MAG: SRPBCC domain-containing protein [Bacteroidota bacterium]